MRPLVVFALDAFDRSLVDPALLPALEGLRARGCHARIVGPETISEHGIWASLLSGRSRGEHGYYHWRPLRSGTYDVELTDLRGLRGLPFWVVAGRECVAVDVPECAPAPGAAGLQVGNWAPHNPRFGLHSEPAHLLAELRERFGDPIDVDERAGTSRQQDLDILRRLGERLAQKRALCRHLIERCRAEVVAIGLHEAHIAGHQFDRYRLDGDTELGRAVRSVYAGIDAAVADVLDAVANDADVVVLSNMGLARDHPNRELTEAFCTQLGYRTPAVSSGIATQAIDVVRKALPGAARRRLIRSLPRATAERLFASRFREATDWSRTTLFAIPSFYVGFLRVNQLGREPAGIVAPGAESERLLDRAEADLRQLVDPLTGRPAVGRILRTERVFGPGASSALPDLCFEWRPTSHRKRRIEHPRAVLEQSDFDWDRSTRHAHEGFVIAAGPSFAARGELGDVDVLDVAPTLWRALGEAPPAGLRGRPVEPMLR